MDRKKKFLVSSTPHLGRSRQLISLFSDIQCSPINVQGPSKSSPIRILNEPKPSSSTTTEHTKAETGKKRRIIRKTKADPESVTTGVLKELGVDVQDVRDNGLSHSRNLYNMFPEPIILDSDEENSVVEKKSFKKPKQDSKVIKSITSENQEEKKRKERLPGKSRSVRTNQVVIDRRIKKESVAQTVTRDPASLKPYSRRKLPNNQENSNSVVILEDNEDDDLFPVYVPGTDVCSSRIKTKSDRLSLELDEKFPIEWGSKPKKTSVIEDNQVQECSPEIEKNNNKGLVEAMKLIQSKKVICTKDISNTVRPKPNHESRQGKGIITVKELNAKHEDKNEVEVISVQTKKRAKQKTVGGLIGSEQSGNDNVNKNDCTDDSKKEDRVMISHFENIVFKPRSNNGGIAARCLKTNENDIGFVEVSTNEVFRGDKENITFVVIEGEAKVTHLGTEHTLVPGDMINIIEGGGYTFESCGTSHVRFLYIKPR